MIVNPEVMDDYTSYKNENTPQNAKKTTENQKCSKYKNVS